MNNQRKNFYRNRGKRKRTSEDASGGNKRTLLSNATEARRNPTTFHLSQSHSVYKNWKFYFDDEDCRRGSPTERKVQAMEGFIARNPDLFEVSNLEKNEPYTIDVEILRKDDNFLDEWNTFTEDLANNPKHTLNCLSLAIDHTMLNKIKLIEGTDDPNILAELPTAMARVSNYRPVMPLRDLKMSFYRKLISIKGCIIRVGSIKHFARWIEFACMSCATCEVIRQVDGIYTLPTKCVACDRKKFRPVLNSPHTKTALFQVITLQEHLGDEQDDKGRTPRTIDVHLIADLVNTCMPGNDVTVTGIVKATESKNQSSKKKNNSTPLSLYMEAVYILSNKYKSQNKLAANLDLTTKDHAAIGEVYRDPNVFKLLVHSMCDSIYGHELIKAGLLLSLFGGTTKTQDVREDIHILMFGDPGLGKSQLLQACSRLASKGVYVCGSSSTSTGLTVTLAKDNAGEVILEPGALVVADKGCCCIDEFDKMSTQHQALLEAMEQQSVSLAKSGMVCCLPAKTSILAAANPAGGRYRRSESLIKNLNMNLPLLSRFDIIFVLLDQPNEHLDDLLSKHIMAVHADKNNKIGNSRASGTSSHSQLPEENTLRQRLYSPTTDRIDPVPVRILRNYISYARQYVKPTLTPAAVEVLQRFYLECRARDDSNKLTPMTPRQLGALIRLTEARAKLELREQATENDALEVVEIIEFSMADVSVEPIQLDRAALSGSGKLTANKVKAFVSLLKQEAIDKASNLFTIKEMQAIARTGSIMIDDFNGLISKLNDNGIILKRGTFTYSFVDQ